MNALRRYVELSLDVLLHVLSHESQCNVALNSLVKHLVGSAAWRPLAVEVFLDCFLKTFSAISSFVLWHCVLGKRGYDHLLRSSS